MGEEGEAQGNTTEDDRQGMRAHDGWPCLKQTHGFGRPQRYRRAGAHVNKGHLNFVTGRRCGLWRMGGGLTWREAGLDLEEG